MIEVKDLLLRFENILLSEISKKEAVRRVVADTLGISLDSKDVVIKNNTVFLRIKPIYKNEIFIKQSEILSRLEQEILGKRPTLNIR